MSKKEKLLKKLFEDPMHADLTIQEVEKILFDNGFEKKSVNGSHHNYLHNDTKFPLTIPTKHGRHVKGIYIKMIREAFIQIGINQ